VPHAPSVARELTRDPGFTTRCLRPGLLRGPRRRRASGRSLDHRTAGIGQVDTGSRATRRRGSCRTCGTRWTSATATPPRSCTTCVRRRSGCLANGRDAAVFTSEPQQDLARFARSFCRDLFARSPHWRADRARQLPGGALVGGTAWRPLPRGSRSSGRRQRSCSRAPTPQEFARWRTAPDRAPSTSPDLRCTEDEAQALLGDTPLDRDTVRRIQHQSDGWPPPWCCCASISAARMRRFEESLGEGRDAIFQYFAGRSSRARNPRTNVR